IEPSQPPRCDSSSPASLPQLPHLFPYTTLFRSHRGEGAWTSNTGNGYFGGLQMDYSFMRAYGGSLLASKGTADHWTRATSRRRRSEEHTSELQSQSKLVCRLLLEKKKAKRSSSD